MSKSKLDTALIDLDSALSSLRDEAVELLRERAKTNPKVAEILRKRAAAAREREEE
jgi:hypothetical protein